MSLKLSGKGKIGAPFSCSALSDGPKGGYNAILKRVAHFVASGFGLSC